MTQRSDSLCEFRLERDTNLLTGDEVARIKYRRNGVRKWSSFVVVLDDETTFETVEANAEHLIVHSGKPEAFLDLVERASPGPYLELFARRRRLGWDVWGNEVDSDFEMAVAPRSADFATRDYGTDVA